MECDKNDHDFVSVTDEQIVEIIKKREEIDTNDEEVEHTEQRTTHGMASSR